MPHFIQVLSTNRRRRLRVAALLATLLLPLLAGAGSAQRGDAPPAPTAARTGAPIDLTGYWVSIVTEDWRWRMMTPPKGDYASVPLNGAARGVGDAWDPVKDEAAGNACKSYGVGNIMRVPGRVHFTWQDENTLRIETDAGSQTRLLHFGEAAPPSSGDAGWQGYSVARWEIAGPQRRGGGGGNTAAGSAAAGAARGDAPPPAASPAARASDRGRGAGPAPVRGGSLKVVTTRMRAGYLRKNGVPYSEHAVVTEYFDRHNEPNGDQWFTVTTIVDDAKYLTEPFITSSHFKKEADGSKWRPTPCAAR